MSIHRAWLNWIVRWSNGSHGPAKRVSAEEETHNWVHAGKKGVRLLGGSSSTAEWGIKAWRPRIVKLCNLLEGIRVESVRWHRVRFGRQQSWWLAVAYRTKSIHFTFLKDHLPWHCFLRGREQASTALVFVTVLWREIKWLMVAGLWGVVTLDGLAFHVLWARKFKVALLHRHSFYGPISMC